MMKSLCSLFLVLIFSVTPAMASAEVLGQFFYNAELRFERAESQNWEARAPLGFSFGVRQDSWSLLLDYSRWSVSTGNNSLSVDLQTEEYLLWLQKDLMVIDWISFAPANFYVGAGGGALQREVQTHLLGQSSSDKSKFYGVFGASVGLQSRWFVFSSLPRLGFALGIEGRAIFSQEYDPNPQASGLVRLGVLF